MSVVVNYKSSIFYVYLVYFSIPSYKNKLTGGLWVLFNIVTQQCRNCFTQFIFFNNICVESLNLFTHPSYISISLIFESTLKNVTTHECKPLITISCKYSGDLYH